MKYLPFSSVEAPKFEPRITIFAPIFWNKQLAGFSAIVLLPLGNIVVERGYSVLILSIAVCIMGGLGSLIGTVIASFIIGFSQVLSIVYLGSRFQMLVALVAIIISLIFFPSGIFGRQKELEERV